MDASDELRILLNRAYDVIERSSEWKKPQFLGFLNEHEAAFLKENISKKENAVFFGGYAGAQRVMLGANAEKEDFPVTALAFSYKPEYALRHKDVLGSLMALGIERDTVGDILTEKGRAVVFLKNSVVPFVESQVTKIGNVGVSVGRADISHLPQQDDFEEIFLTLSSLRLDVFVAAVTRLSRENAAALIKSELVAVNHLTEKNLSKTLKEGSTVTIRKYGKFVFTASQGVSKKGKLRITVRHLR